MDGLLAKKAGEMMFGATEQPEPDAQQGGKKKKIPKKKSSDEESENLDPWKEISKVLFNGGNIEKKTFFENEFNYPLIILGIFILFKIYTNNN